MTETLLLPFFLFFLLQHRRRWQRCRHLPFWCYYSKEGDDSFAIIVFFVALQKATSPSIFLFSFCWFRCSEKVKDDSFYHLLWWLCYKKMATFAFFGGFVAKKVTTTISSPSLWWNTWRRWWQAIFIYLFIYFWSLWFSSLKLTITNEMVVFLCWRLQWLKERDWRKKVVVIWKLISKIFLHHIRQLLSKMLLQ